MNIGTLIGLPALSIRQPWASLIVAGDKSIELRKWPTDYRGWMWLHASRQVDTDAMNILGLAARDFPTGGLLGIGLLSSCRLIKSREEWRALKHEHRSPADFSTGVFAWAFEDVIALRERIPARGELRLFHFDSTSKAQLESALLGVRANQEFMGSVDGL